MKYLVVALTLALAACYPPETGNGGETPPADCGPDNCIEQ